MRFKAELAKPTRRTCCGLPNVEPAGATSSMQGQGLDPAHILAELRKPAH